MAVSFTPDWQSTTTTGSTLTIGAPTGGSVHVALVAVGDGATIVDTGGMLEQSVTRINPYSGFDVRVYTLTRPSTSAPVELELSAAATACGIVGAFPPGAYELLPPFTWTPVTKPGYEGWEYQNPQEIGNSGGSFFVPAPGGAMAGFFVSARDVGDPDPFTLTSTEGAVDKSADLLVTDGDMVRIRLAGWAFEPDGPDPALVAGNDWAWSSEYRWIGVLGGEAPPPISGFRVGRIGFATAGPPPGPGHDWYFWGRPNDRTLGPRTYTLDAPQLMEMSARQETSSTSGEWYVWDLTTMDYGAGNGIAPYNPTATAYEYVRLPAGTYTHVYTWIPLVYEDPHPPGATWTATLTVYDASFNPVASDSATGHPADPLSPSLSSVTVPSGGGYLAVTISGNGQGIPDHVADNAYVEIGFTY